MHLKNFLIHLFFIASFNCAQASVTPCVPDKKYDEVLSAAQPKGEQECRRALKEIEQELCSETTYKKDWGNFVKQRRARLDLYQQEYNKMIGGTDTANLFALYDYAKTGHIRMEKNTTLNPSKCVLKRREVAMAATDFGDITLALNLWVAAQGKLSASRNTKAYGEQAACSRAMLHQAFHLSEQALGLIKKVPAIPKNC